MPVSLGVLQADEKLRPPEMPGRSFQLFPSVYWVNVPLSVHTLCQLKVGHSSVSTSSVGRANLHHSCVHPFGHLEQPFYSPWECTCLSVFLSPLFSFTAIKTQFSHNTDGVLRWSRHSYLHPEELCKSSRFFWMCLKWKCGTSAFCLLQMLHAAATLMAWRHCFLKSLKEPYWNPVALKQIPLNL